MQGTSAADSSQGCEHTDVKETLRQVKESEQLKFLTPKVIALSVSLVRKEVR